MNALSERCMETIRSERRGRANVKPASDHRLRALRQAGGISKQKYDENGQMRKYFCVFSMSVSQSNDDRTPHPPLCKINACVRFGGLGAICGFCAAGSEAPRARHRFC
jgi:CRISPR/Cas system-associated endonuclease Cas1